MLGGKILMATSRESRVSFARYTSPVPPAPSEATISYEPSLLPEVRAILTRHYIRKGSVLQLTLCFWTNSLYRGKTGICIGVLLVPGLARLLAGVECQGSRVSLLSRPFLLLSQPRGGSVAAAAKIPALLGKGSKRQ